MTATPDRTRVTFPGISSRAYEHPADRTALVALRRLGGFEAVLRKLSGVFRERALRLMFVGSAVRVSDQQFRRVHDIVRDAARALDLERVPEVFVTQSPLVSAQTLGVDTPFIVLSTGLLDLMDDEELRFVVGHEVGHVLSGHAVYRTMLFQLLRLVARGVWLPLGALGLRAIIAALEEWFRKSELSCDRAGLLVGQDEPAAVRSLMKTAGGSRLHEMSVDAFLAQAAEYDAGGDLREGVAKILNLQGQLHPFAVVRAGELHRWGRGPEYARILDGDYPRRSDDRQTSWQEEVRATARSYRESAAESTDPLVRLLRDLGDDVQSTGEKIFARFGRREE